MMPEQKTIKLIVGSPKRRMNVLKKNSSKKMKPAPIQKKYIIAEAGITGVLFRFTTAGRTRKMTEINMAWISTIEIIISPDR